VVEVHKHGKISPGVSVLEHEACMKIVDDLHVKEWTDNYLHVLGREVRP
jgi:hypothetical protein